jgi:UDP-N-acetylglucosamine 1-carboxyvinyltransferase
MCALLTTVQGTSIIRETVIDSRFQYVGELERMGARINVDGRQAFIDGGTILSGTDVAASDLRAGMSLITAGLAAVGETRLTNVPFVDRGYEEIDVRLRNLGADIVRRTVTNADLYEPIH